MPLIPAWGLGTRTQGTAALSLLDSASLRCLPPGALDPRPPQGQQGRGRCRGLGVPKAQTPRLQVGIRPGFSWLLERP